MIFKEQKLKGVFVIEPEKKEDNRGFFARTYCSEEFQKRGLVDCAVQCNLSYSKKAGTLRGMHYQAPPFAEAKLIRCTYGAIFDVMIDLRPESLTYKKWLGIKVNAANRQLLYVPEGFAHGFQTLTDHTEVFYQVSRPFTPEAERGIRWNDPAFGIQWPLAVSVISGKDQVHPLFV
ncbi:MAG: dTDP-4-dehydrorhamnose 3,5-epimerase [Parachlamydiales bacterium]|nr:dTDP-4-dehydrorhamnose 3,5-epimerase [Parachlamydiales bacterium]